MKKRLLSLVMALIMAIMSVPVDLRSFADKDPDKVASDLSFSENEGPIEAIIQNKDPEKRKYKVTFSFQNGKNDLIEYYDENSLVARPEDPKASILGNAFSHWISREGSKKEKYDFNTPITKDLLLVATYVQKNHEVSFDTDGGKEVPDVQIVKHDDKVIKPKDPTKEGHKFLGWYDGNKLFDFENKTITEKITLIAKWKKLHTVTFDFQNGGVTPNVVGSYEDGSVIQQPKELDSAPLKGYEFDHWMIRKGNKKEKYDPNTQIVEDLYLIAKYKLKEYKITFDPDGGSTDPEIRYVKYNNLVQRPKDPTKEGHKFLGWYLGEKLFDFDKDRVDGELILKADWKQNEYEINFEGSKGETLGSQKVVHGTFIDQEKLPNILEVEGFVFDYWYDKAVGKKEKFDIGTVKITKEMTLVAKYKAASYTVNFEGSKGETLGSQKVVHGTFIDQEKLPNIPEVEGFVFDYWYDKAVGKKEKFDIGTAKITKEMTLVAKYKAASYTVNFEGSKGETLRSQKVVHGTFIDQEKLPNIPEVEGHRFRGWSLDGKDLFDIINTKITKDITLKSVWELKEYKVTFDTDGGSKDPEEQIIKHDGKITRPKDPTKEGYEFLGWYLGEEKFDLADHKVVDHIKLTAKWEKLYKVTFSYANGKTKDLVRYYKKGETVEEPKDKPIAAFDRYGFDHWAIRKDSKEVKYDFKTPITEDLHLVAKYKLKEYKVTFNTDQGSKDPEEQTIKHDGKVTKPDDPTKEGYEFLGWYLGEVKFDFANQKVTDNIILIAKWEKIYKVTFSFGDGKTKDLVKYYKKGETVEEPKVDQIPVLESHKFDHWAVRKDSKEVKYDFKTPISEDLHILARYKIKEYEITFDTDNGKEMIVPQIVEHGNNVKDPGNVTKEGYKFLGWYLDDKQFSFDTEITKDITLIAKWEIKSYTVTFNSDGGSDVAQKTVKYNETVGEIVDPTKDGHTFKEWQLNDKTFDLQNEKITEDITLKAVWTPIATPPANPPAQGNPSVPANPGAQPAQPAPQPPTTGGGGGGGGGASTPTTITDNAVPLASPEDDTIAIFKIGSKEYQLKEDGKLTAKTSDLAPLINRSRTMLPVRITGEVLGIKADYDNKIKTAKFTYIDDNKKENIIEMTIGKNKMKVNGVEQALTADIMVVEGRMILPISDVQKAFRQLGLKVEILWNNETKEVTLIRTDK